jgi:hypothetical protein
MRDRWDVIPVEDLDTQGDEVRIKKGRDYQKGASPWKLIGDHDSCWRDSVESFLRDREPTILGFDSVGSWNEVVTLTDDVLKELEALREASRGARR